MKDDFYTRDYDLPTERLTAAIVKALAALALVAIPFILALS